MGCRDGFVNLPLSLPEELVYILEVYRKNMKIISRNAAVRHLLETHPDIALVVAGVYDNLSGPDGIAHGERVAQL